MWTGDNNRYTIPGKQNFDGEHGSEAVMDLMPPSPSSGRISSNGCEMNACQGGSNVATVSPRAEEIRQKCRNSLLEKAPKILLERLKKEGSLLLENLTVLEVQLVNYNPSVFSIYIDMPRCPIPKVKMLRDVAPEELDFSGRSGNLRHAFDEELVYLTTSKLMFSRVKEDVRECAVMAFVPPRCFIFCDGKGTENDERLLSISEGLENAIVNGSAAAASNIRPGEALVGARDGVYMRVAVLHGDDQSGEIRCVCLDYNAVHNFDRSELFPLPDGFSVDEVPANAFLGRIRGTHYIYDDMYDAAYSLCKPNDYEGLVPLVLCAIYGRTAFFFHCDYTRFWDHLTIVDVCISIADGWLSERLVNSKVAAPFEPDSRVKITPFEAEEMLKDKKRREAAHLINSNQPISGKFDIRRKNLKNSVVCGKCGSEIPTRKGQRDKKRGRKLSSPEGVKSWNGVYPKETITDAVCRRVPSVTEQLMSVARKMHAEEEQEAEERLLSDDGAQDDVRVSQTLEVGADMRTLSHDNETTSGTEIDRSRATNERGIATSENLEGFKSERAEPPPLSPVQRPTSSNISRHHKSSEEPCLRDFEGKENINGNKCTKPPRTIDYFSIENAEECGAVRCCKPKTERKTLLPGQAATTKSDCSGKVTKSNGNDVQQKKAIEIHPDSGTTASATENRQTSEDRERCSPERAEPPPPLLVQSTITKVGSKPQMPQSHLDEAGTDESSTGTALSAAAEDIKSGSRTEFERFSVPMLSPTSSSVRSDANGEKSLENLKSVLKLYEAARRCSKEPSSQIESTDLFVTMAIANAGRLLIGTPKTVEEKQIANKLLSFSDPKGTFRVD
nr:unnamed protein product [Haemonchus contortus]